MSRPNRILVVDDEERSRSLLQEILASLGYTPECASDGFEALENIKSGFDLVLLDVIMPEMDGFEVVRRIRDDPEICDIPVIMVTVLEDRDTRLRAVQSGANDFIGKPIDRIEVSVRVESLLKMKEAQDQIKRHHTKLEDAVEKRTAELAESERRFRIMADFSQDLEYWQGTDGQLIYVSPSCERITGYSPNELKADPDLLNRIIHPDDRALVMLHSKEVHGGLNGDQGSFNFRIVSKDKRVVWVNHVCRSVVGEQGEWLGTRVDNRNVTPQKLLEDALEKTRKLLGLVMDSLPVAIFYLDSEQRFGMANQTFRSWWGRSKDDFAGLTISEVLGDHYHEISGHLERVLTGEEVRYETSVKHGDGVMRDISLVLVPDRAAVGEIRGLACLISDITERKRYEEELLRTRMAVDGASDAIGMASLDGEHFYQNRTFGDLLGYTIEDLRGPDGILRAFKDLDAARVLFETIQQGLGWTGEVEMLAKDGRSLTVYVRADAIRDAQGSITSLIGIMTDITKLRTVQQALNIRTTALLESEKRFKTLVESASDAIFIKDNELRYTDVNTVMVSFLDMQLSDIIGKTDKDVFGNDIAVQTRDVESRVLEGQTIETQESLIYKSQPISVDCIRFPLRGSSNEIMGVCGIVREMVYRSQMTSDAVSPGDDYVSPAMRSTLSKARLAAETNSIILLTGESGSGKDHLARYIHDHSSRCHGPLYSVNCAAIPSELAESELFGHEAGAFTGAVRRKRGLMELAEGGTLLLNEIGELSNVLQGKLLTFLDTFSFTRVGGEKKVTVNIRLLAATSKDLRSEVSEARFRKDLYYRLDVFPIHVPTLRERNEDIPVLVKEILSRLAENMVLRETPSVSFDALRLLCLYSWPGNVRELRNILERSLILSRGETIGVQHLVGMGETEKADSLVNPSKPLNRSLHDILRETERTLIEEALQRSGGNKAEAARCLGISPFALARHMTKLEIIWR